ncbi:hypothetical protein [Blastococcus sp. Marseille-P5729]|uniref:hypothetical protein n=1 Tax=Blastococcus sp. Marseille-P5729 TaxID=2086582 RepID=UPI000D10ED4A|nr:hypothetical protein [Blastococcus sp. Marseille-P5729]
MNDEPRASREAAGPDRVRDGAADQSEPPERTVHVVRGRRAPLSAEERAFLERYRRDLPPHHDSSWG